MNAGQASSHATEDGPQCWGNSLVQFTACASDITPSPNKVHRTTRSTAASCKVLRDGLVRLERHVHVRVLRRHVGTHMVHAVFCACAEPMPALRMQLVMATPRSSHTSMKAGPRYTAAPAELPRPEVAAGRSRHFRPPRGPVQIYMTKAGLWAVRSACSFGRWWAASSARQLVGGSFRSALPAGTRVCPESAPSLALSPPRATRYARMASSSFRNLVDAKYAACRCEPKANPATRRKGTPGGDV